MAVGDVWVGKSGGGGGGEEMVQWFDLREGGVILRTTDRERFLQCPAGGSPNAGKKHGHQGQKQLSYF